MMENAGRANIIHYSSNLRKRVTRSAMESEIHAPVAGFGYAFLLRHLTRELLNHDMSLDAYIDNRDVFDFIAKDGRTCE